MCFSIRCGFFKLACHVYTGTSNKLRRCKASQDLHYFTNTVVTFRESSKVFLFVCLKVWVFLRPACVHCKFLWRGMAAAAIYHIYFQSQLCDPATEPWILMADKRVKAVKPLLKQNEPIKLSSPSVHHLFDPQRAAGLFVTFISLRSDLIKRLQFISKSTSWYFTRLPLWATYDFNIPETRDSV